MKPPRRPHSFADVAPELRGAVVENMKERIYATITLLAVIATLWHESDHHTVFGSVGAIVGSVIALWLATIISTRLSHRAIHGRRINYHEYRHAVFVSSGLLAPAAAPTLLVLLSAAHIMSLRAALATSLVILLLSLLLISLLASRRIYANPWRALFVSSLEMFVGLGVIVFKILLGE